MAALKVESVVLGLADVVAKMQNIPRQVGGNIVRNALRDGAQVISLEARRLAPVQKGAKGGLLRRSIQGESDRPKRNDSVIVGRVIVRGAKTARRNPRAYAHLVEFGTQPHAVGRGSKLKATGRKKALQLGPQHPGAKAIPFVRPAYESKRNEALEVIAARIRRDVEYVATSGGKAPTAREGTR